MKFLEKLQIAQIEDRFLGLFDDTLSEHTKEIICSLENEQIREILLDAMGRTSLDEPDLDSVVHMLLSQHEFI